MSSLPAVAQLMIDKKTVYAAVLLFADFEGDPARFWFGPTQLRTLDGNLWEGGGAVISLDVLGPPTGTTAQPATAKLSGVNQKVIQRIVENMDVAVERDVIAYVQFFGDGELAEQYLPIGDPVAIGGWVSDQLTFDKTADTDYAVSLSLESYFVGRSRSPSSYFSFNEQRDRAIAMGVAVDNGGAFMTSLQNKKINFPDY